jgi:hypothetical protein
VARGGSGACGRRGRARALGRPWVTVRAHYGALPSMAGRDRGRWGNLLDACARKHGPGDRKRRDGTSRGVAVCLYFPAIRETSRGRYTTKVRLSAFRLPLFRSRARSPETPTHANKFAGGDDACPKEGVPPSRTLNRTRIFWRPPSASKMFSEIDGYAVQARV